VGPPPSRGYLSAVLLHQWRPLLRRLRLARAAYPFDRYYPVQPFVTYSDRVEHESPGSQGQHTAATSEEGTPWSSKVWPCSLHPRGSRRTGACPFGANDRLIAGVRGGRGVAARGPGAGSTVGACDHRGSPGLNFPGDESTGGAVVRDYSVTSSNRLLSWAPRSGDKILCCPI
jgi:hypothetical protein